MEGEYSYRTATYGGPSQVVFGGTVLQNKAEQELEESESGAEDLLAHNLFLNVYYDFASGSRVTPYVGFGAGGARASLDYFSRWKRNDDPDRITTLRNHESDVGRGFRILQGSDG